MRTWFSSLTAVGNHTGKAALEIAGRVISLGRSIGADIPGSLVSTSAQILDGSRWLYEGVGKANTATTSVVGEAFEKLLMGAVDLSRQAGNMVDYTLDQLAENSNDDQHFSAKGIRMALGLLPIIGNTQGYAQARLKYRHALALEEQELRQRELHEARRDCLIVSAALSLEIATLGISGKINMALRSGSIVLSMLNLAKVAREESAKSSWLPKVNIDLLSSHADTALRFASIRDAMDFLLQVDAKGILGDSADNAGLNLRSQKS